MLVIIHVAYGYRLLRLLVPPEFVSSDNLVRTFRRIAFEVRLRYRGQLRFFSHGIKIVDLRAQPVLERRVDSRNDALLVGVSCGTDLDARVYALPTRELRLLQILYADVWAGDALRRAGERLTVRRLFLPLVLRDRQASDHLG